MFFLSSEMNLFFRNVFFLPKLAGVFSEIGNNLLWARWAEKKHAFLLMRNLNLKSALI